MPLLSPGLERRSLLRLLGATAVTISTHAKESHVRWALLSDTHISADTANEYRGFHPYDNLRRVVPEVADWKPEGLLINGDLARQEGLPADYELFKKCLTPLAGVPAGFTLGNHDDRSNFFRTVGKPASGEPQAVKEKHVVVVQHGGLRMILLDSLYQVNQAAGLLGKGQRAWLDSYLQSVDATPVLIFVHHTLDDGDSSMLDADRFLRIAVKHRKVKAIFYGHSHHYGYDTMDGLHLVNQPAVGYNFADSEPVGWLQAVLSTEGAELTLHAIGGNRRSDGQKRALSWRS